MKKIVPESKFRHLKGQSSAKDQTYDGVIASETRLESNICAVNRKFIAVVLATSGGGVFTVLRRDKPGRVDRVFRCLGHTSEIVDLSFDRFNPNRIVSGGEDGSYLVWWIPDEGLVADLDQIQCQLKSSQRRVVQSEWHPSAVDILIGVNIDSINVFNVATAQLIFSINTSVDNDAIYNASVNYDGTAIAASFKDKHVRIYDLVTREKIKEFSTHRGTKPIKVAWITQAFNEDIVVTTGATKMSEREICLWRISDPSAPIFTENLGNATASFNITYDSDSRVLAFYGRGECSIKFYELMSEPEPVLYSLTVHQSSESQRGVAFGNKMTCNFVANEIMHSVRILSKSLEEVSFIVPRKSDTFQDDLFPDSAGEIPAMTAEEYVEGKVANPVKVSLRNFIPETTHAFANLRSVHSFSKENEKGSPRSSVPPFAAVNTLVDDVATLKSELASLHERVRALEEK